MPNNVLSRRISPATILSQSIDHTNWRQSKPMNIAELEGTAGIIGVGAQSLLSSQQQESGSVASRLMEPHISQGPV